MFTFEKDKYGIKIVTSDKVPRGTIYVVRQKDQRDIPISYDVQHPHNKFWLRAQNTSEDLIKFMIEEGIISLGLYNSRMPDNETVREFSLTDDGKKHLI